jgi:hypothetical protein
VLVHSIGTMPAPRDPIELGAPMLLDGGKKISELSTAELFELNARLSTGAVSDAERPPVEELN